MTNLSNSVYNEYRKRLDELPFEYRFHFASRLYLWSQDPAAKELLLQYQAEFTGNDVAKTLQDIVEKSVESEDYGNKSTAALREPYFKKYPRLKAIDLAMFRVVFLEKIYGQDHRAELFALFPKTELDQLLEDLKHDPAALAMLSTHAVNFIYLYEKILQDKPVDTTIFLDAAKHYDLQNPLHVRLYVYLFTHCIIGESQFYCRPIAQVDLPQYLNMMGRLEQLIGKTFDDVSLDNKLEFLVCARLTGYETTLEQRIQGEAENSVSKDGMFLVDARNNYSTDIVKSEHRNVLYVLANRGFTPPEGFLGSGPTSAVSAQ